MMVLTLAYVKGLVDSFAPEGSPRRKVVQVVSVVLLFEGLSVLALYSYFGIVLGVASIAIGLLLMILLYRQPDQSIALDEPIGVRLLSKAMAMVGGDYVVMSMGALLIVLVFIFNLVVSNRPEYGDADTITTLLGGLLIAYPVIAPKARVEMSFALLFVGLVFSLLAAPQAVTAIFGGDDSNAVSSWYVHYMLAAPFAGSLDLIGVPSSVQGNIVTLTFEDGSVHSLSISTYCAGLYSFSIFLAAFLSFVLVFEKMSVRLTVTVLSLGLVAAYLGNLIRMILIGVIGYFEGIDALLWAHRNVGWMVFLSWSSLFWYLIFRYAQGRSTGTAIQRGRDESTGD